MIRRGKAPPPVKVASRPSEKPHESKIHRRIIAEDLDIESMDEDDDHDARGKAMHTKGEEEDDEDTNEELASEVKMRKGSIRRDVPVRATPGSKRMDGLPPRPSSSVSTLVILLSTN
jgi:hypothetical protein